MTDFSSNDLDDFNEDSFGDVASKKVVTDDAVDSALLIDDKQLKDLINLIGMDTFDVIMDDFRNEITQRFEILNKEALDLKEVARELHIIISCGGNLGMSKFSLLARQIMNKLDRDEQIDASAQLKRLQAVYADSLKLFLLKKQGLKNSSIGY